MSCEHLNCPCLRDLARRYPFKQYQAVDSEFVPLLCKLIYKHFPDVNPGTIVTAELVNQALEKEGIV